MPNTDTNQKPGSGSATCSAAEELAHLKELAKAAGFASITDAVTTARRLRGIEDEIKAKIARRKRELYGEIGLEPDFHQNASGRDESLPW